MNKKEQALALRLDGLTYKEIGDQMSISRQYAQMLITPPAAIKWHVINKANGCCEGCGLRIGKSGHIHHIKAKGKTADTYHELENLALLCPSCHRKAHNGGLPAQPLPEQMPPVRKRFKRYSH